MKSKKKAKETVISFSVPEWFAREYLTALTIRKMTGNFSAEASPIDRMCIFVAAEIERAIKEK